MSTVAGERGVYPWLFGEKREEACVTGLSPEAGSLSSSVCQKADTLLTADTQHATCRVASQRRAIYL